MKDYWNEIYSIPLKNKEKYIDAFGKLLAQIIVQSEPFSDKVEDKGDYYIVTEKERNGAYFVHLVPKKLYAIFRELERKAQNRLVAYSVLCGRRNNKEVRATLFGIKLEEVQGRLGK